MKIKLPDAKYVVAVSGGVDSVVLLDLLRTDPALELVVAHFNHGIRRDSADDERLVVDLANQYKLKHEVGRAKLGSNVSEATARLARYKFLCDVKGSTGSDYIVTAHHQDDMIETAVINLLRGSRYRGLIAISDNHEIKRPLLDIPKAIIVKYAKDNNLKWREDSTNSSDTYLRNYIRHHIIPKLSGKQRQELLENIDKVAKINRELHATIATLSHNVINNSRINRHKFTMLPTEVANELLVDWLRRHNIAYDSKLVQSLSLCIKTAKPRSSASVSKNMELVFDGDSALFKPSRRST